MELGLLIPQGTSTAKIFLLNFNHHGWVWDQPIPRLRSYQSPHGFFFISLAEGCLFS